MSNTTTLPIGKYISQIYRKGSAYITKELSEFGISSGQIMYLTQLYIKDGIRQEELVEKLNIDKAATCRSIKKLEESGFITRERDENDKRAYKICLTQKAKDLKETILKVLKQCDVDILETLTEEEANFFLQILVKVCENQNIK